MRSATLINLIFITTRIKQHSRGFQTSNWEHSRQSNSTSKMSNSRYSFAFCVTKSQNLYVVNKYKNCAYCHCSLGGYKQQPNGSLKPVSQWVIKKCPIILDPMFSQFLKGNSNDKALGTVLFLISAFFVSVNMEGSNALEIGLLRVSILALITTSYFTPQCSTITPPIWYSYSNIKEIRLTMWNCNFSDHGFNLIVW